MTAAAPGQVGANGEGLVLTHLDEHGAAHMVDVSGKGVSVRTARAAATVLMSESTLRLIAEGALPKGDVLATARLAGIMAAKRTCDLVPLCHPLPIEAAAVELVPAPPDRLAITATVTTSARTGVEMEALTAVSVAALTVYDMCKAVDRAMAITDVVLEEKAGGRSGHFRRAGAEARLETPAGTPADERSTGA